MGEASPDPVGGQKAAGSSRRLRFRPAIRRNMGHLKAGDVLLVRARHNSTASEVRHPQVAWLPKARAGEARLLPAAPDPSRRGADHDPLPGRGQVTSRAKLLLSAAALAAAGLAAWGVAATAERRTGTRPGQLLIARSTDAQLRDRVPVARHLGEKPRSVFSRPLPTVNRGDRISFNGEVTLTMTCVERLPRCIGRMYHYSPRFRAQIVIARRAGAAGRQTEPVSDAVTLTCGQHRPNRNHHCPLVIDGGSMTVSRPRSLPCPPR